LIEDEGARFENLVAFHLLKWCHFTEDTDGFDVELRYFRDIALREVDFVVVKDRKPHLFVEAKLSDKVVSPHLIYLKRKFPGVRAVQVVRKEGIKFLHKEGIEVISASDFLMELV
jgi:predicted AAA+ superfamily ATPase